MKRSILALILLAGCAGDPKPDIPARVTIPVSQGCNPELPSDQPLAGKTVDLGADIFVLVKAVLQDRNELARRDDAKTKALEACR